MQFKTFVFDAYGTLFDVHSAVRKHAESLGPDGLRLSELWRTKQLEYSWVRTLMGSYSDFWRLTEEALDFSLAAMPHIDASCRDKLLEAYWTLDCYPEVRAVLSRLHERGARTAILSNGSPDMLSAAIDSAGLGDAFDGFDRHVLEFVGDDVAALGQFGKRCRIIISRDNLFVCDL